MSARRIRSTVSGPWVQPLKLATTNNLVIAPSAAYNQVVYRQDRKPPVYETVVAAKWDSADCNGIHLKAFLWKNRHQLIHGADCVFDIFVVSESNVWTETLLASVSGVQQADGSFTADVSEVTLGLGDCLDGKRVLAVSSRIRRFHKQYRQKVFFNGLGIYNSYLDARRNIEWLTLTKKDE